MHTRLNYWEYITQNMSFDQLAKDLNPTWNSSNRSYTEHTPMHNEVLDIIEHRDLCLDFGVGLGRNLDYLKSNFVEVIGYDTAPMIEKFRTYRSDYVTHDWSEIESKRFNLVYECTVFQHMDVDILKDKLLSISEISTYLYCRTRVYNDVGRDFQQGTGGTNIYSLIESLEIFTPEWCSIPVQQARDLMDETHYDILYKV